MVNQYFSILISCLFFGVFLGTANSTIAGELKLNKIQFKLSYDNQNTNLLYGNYYESKNDYLKFDSINTENSSLLQKSIEYTHKGYTHLALSSIQKVIQLAKKNQDSNLLIRAEGILGNIHFINGDYQNAIASYQKSLDLAKSVKDNLAITIAWNNLANTWNNLEKDYQSQTTRVRSNTIEVKSLEKLTREAHNAALYAASQALKNSKDQINNSAVRAWINWHRLNNVTEVNTAVPLSILDQIPSSRSQVYLYIDLAKLSPNSAIEILQKAIYVANTLKDDRALSFALGALGNIYEQKKQTHQAIKYTEKAILTAQAIFAADSLYNWQWQLGRLYKSLGQNEKAKSYYREAIATLQFERSETIAFSKQKRWKFRDFVEPVYRELIEILLASNQTQEINEALNVFELLNLQELKNYFADDCVEITKIVNANLKQNLRQKNAAVLSSIILPQHTYIILTLPSGRVKSHKIEITRDELSVQIESWHKLLTNIATNRYLKSSQSLYNLLIQPLEKDLDHEKFDTLVLIQDGILRNVPLAALHDGQKFLVEKYAIANVLGLNLINKKSVDKKMESKILAFGLSEAVENFNDLPYVIQEIDNISSIIKTKKLINEDFIVDELKEQIQEDYTIVHFATHGQFNGTKENSFIRSFDSRISLKQLESILNSRKNPLNLLVLSACETSLGDNRSALGLAGVLARSGTVTALGSLWSINDAATAEFMTDFYQNLANPGTSKATALRQAQLNQISNSLGHPATWSPFLLIGNWQ